MIRTRLRHVTALAILLVGAPVGAYAADCECRHLEALQIELRNALRLQQAFNAAIPGLRTLSAPAAQARLQELAQSLGEGGFVRRPAGDRGPGAVDYVPYGDSVADVNRRQTARDLCDPSDGSRQALEQARNGAVCKGIGDAVQAHEDVHHATCRQIGYPRYRDLHAAERAMEEVQAYGAQIRALRAEIARVLERVQPRLEMEQEATSRFPPGVPMRSITIRNRGEARAERVAAEADRYRFDVQGSTRMDASVDGSCRFTSNFPVTLGVRGSMTTDGLEAQISFAQQGTLPGSGLYCTIPGAGSGMGMSMPMPVPPTGPSISMPLRDGETWTRDLAGAGAPGGGQRGAGNLSGQFTLRLFLCPAPR